MSRWQPDAPLRLQQAAMELFHEKGYEAATVEEIAQRANLTPRTFFRYFADKREVLFWGTEIFEEAVLESLRKNTSPDPLARVVNAFETIAFLYFDSRAEAVKRRRKVIQSSPDLQEREGQKMAKITGLAADILVEEGIASEKARLAVELGVLVFRRAFDRWAASEGPTLTSFIQDSLAELRRLTQGI